MTCDTQPARPRLCGKVHHMTDEARRVYGLPPYAHREADFARNWAKVTITGPTDEELAAGANGGTIIPCGPKPIYLPTAPMPSICSLRP